MNKSIPFSLETEKQVLITLIQNPNLLIDFVDQLNPSDFYEPSLGRGFEVLTHLYNSNKPINEAIFYEEVSKRDKNFSPSLLIDSYCCDIYTLNQFVHNLKSLAKRRDLIIKTQKLLASLHEEKPHDQLMEELDRSLFDMSLSKEPRKHISSLTFDAMMSLEDRIDGKGLIRTGFEQLDSNISGGLFAGQLVIIGARTSIGKTSFAVSLAHNVMNLGSKVMFISLEMPNQEIIYKSLSIESGVPFHKIMSGAHREFGTKPIITDAFRRIQEWPYLLEDSKYSLNDIKVECRRAKKEDDVKLIIIDYLGLIHADRYKENKVLEIAHITRSLKLLAKELQIPIVVLCQLNREGGKSAAGDNIPSLVHLRDSGAIEQDADLVLLLYREYYYNDQADPHDAMLIIAKQRLGPTGRYHIYYEPTTMHFRDER